MDIYLDEISKNVYTNIGLHISAYTIERESAVYNASQFNLNNNTIIYRTAKVTPKKAGQFVTFWKRDLGKPITPFEASDAFDFLIVTAVRDQKIGQFIFPKSVLIAQGIISTPTKEGKRALRVYPDWDTPISKQAINTQKWQQKFFYIVDQNKGLQRAKELLSLK